MSSETKEPVAVGATTDLDEKTTLVGSQTPGTLLVPLQQGKFAIVHQEFAIELSRGVSQLKREAP